MMISGYMLAFSLKDVKSLYDVERVLLSRIKSFIIPQFSWSIILLIICIMDVIISNNNLVITLPWLFEKEIYCFLNVAWFLWAIWWCTVIVIINKFFLNDNLFICVIVFLACFFVPDEWGITYILFTYPFFVLGYIFNR